MGPSVLGSLPKVSSAVQWVDIERILVRRQFVEDVHLGSRVFRVGVSNVDNLRRGYERDVPGWGGTSIIEILPVRRGRDSKM